LRHALCRRATPTTPVSDPVLIARFRVRNPAAFPVQMADRRSQRPFRGLLGLYSRCGPSTRRPTLGGPMFRELQRFGYPPRRLGSYRDVPTISRAGLSPARNTAPLRGAPVFSHRRALLPAIKDLRRVDSTSIDSGLKSWRPTTGRSPAAGTEPISPVGFDAHVGVDGWSRNKVSTPRW
jgi:hypothetical protein